MGAAHAQARGQVSAAAVREVALGHPVLGMNRPDCTEARRLVFPLYFGGKGDKERRSNKSRTLLSLSSSVGSQMGVPASTLPVSEGPEMAGDLAMATLSWKGQISVTGVVFLQSLSPSPLVLFAPFFR